MDIPPENEKSLQDQAVLPNVTRSDVCADDLNTASGLAERQEEALRLLLCGRSVAHIAQKLEIHRQTLWRWRRDPLFAREFRRRAEAIWDDSARRLRGMLHPALDIIEGHLRDRYERVRFRAAQTILNLSNIKKFVVPPDEDGRDGFSDKPLLPDPHTPPENSISSGGTQHDPDP